MLFLPEKQGKQSPDTPEHERQDIYAGSDEYYITDLGHKFHPRTVIGNDGTDIRKDCEDEAGQHPVKFPAYRL